MFCSKSTSWSAWVSIAVKISLLQALHWKMESVNANTTLTGTKTILDAKPTAISFSPRASTPTTIWDAFASALHFGMNSRKDAVYNVYKFNFRQGSQNGKEYASVTRSATGIPYPSIVICNAVKSLTLPVSWMGNLNVDASKNSLGMKTFKLVGECASQANTQQAIFSKTDFANALKSEPGIMFLNNASHWTAGRLPTLLASLRMGIIASAMKCSIGLEISTPAFLSVVKSTILWETEKIWILTNASANQGQCGVRRR